MTSAPLSFDILLHSSTGNTRLVSRYAAETLRHLGHKATLLDVQRGGRVHRSCDALIVAAPTMYFRPTYAIEEAVANLPPIREPKPAFLLATCGGMPGAPFPILAELLLHKGYVVFGAHFVVFESNYPMHRAWVEPVAPLLRFGRPIARWLNTKGNAARALTASVFLGEADPTVKDRDALEGFLEQAITTTRAPDFANPPTPRSLNPRYIGTVTMGQTFQRRFASEMGPRFVEKKCTGCGLCVRLCPAHCLTQSEPTTVPQRQSGCTGCQSCFNHCPEGAIATKGVPAGWGQYRGPSQRMKELFAVRAERR